MKTIQQKYEKNVRIWFFLAFFSYANATYLWVQFLSEQMLTNNNKQQEQNQRFLTFLSLEYFYIIDIKSFIILFLPFGSSSENFPLIKKRFFNFFNQLLFSSTEQVSMSTFLFVFQICQLKTEFVIVRLSQKADAFCKIESFCLSFYFCASYTL